MILENEILIFGRLIVYGVMIVRAIVGYCQISIFLNISVSVFQQFRVEFSCNNHLLLSL